MDTDKFVIKRDKVVDEVFVEVARIYRNKKYNEKQKKRLVRHWLKYAYDEGASNIVRVFNNF